MKVSSKRHNYSEYLKYLPLILILILIPTIYFTGIYHEFTFESIKEKHLMLQDYVQNHPVLSPVIFIAVYIVSILLILPDATLLTLLAGYLFPFSLALSYTLFSETIGAYLFFLIVGNAIPPAKKSFLKKMSEKFRSHASSYLLSLRFPHIIPYVLINSIAAYFKVRHWTFIWTTFVGVIPLNYLLIGEGHGLAKVFAEERHFTWVDIFNTHVQIALIVCALLALAPLAYETWKKRRR